jgi:ElaB/YqjD/DUF883 family membrane-anchored ribosome-binding protein
MPALRAGISPVSERFCRAICNFERAEYGAIMNAEERAFDTALENNDQVEQLQKAVQEHGREWLATAEEWVKENPYLALGIAFAAGCAVAALLNSRD